MPQVSIRSTPVSYTHRFPFRTATAVPADSFGRPERIINTQIEDASAPCSQGSIYGLIVKTTPDPFAPPRFVVPYRSPCLSKTRLPNENRGRCRR